jgi:hypothetical protein
MDGVRAHRIAGSVAYRHEEESDRTKKDHPGPEGREHEEFAWSCQRRVEGPEKKPI